MTATATDLQVRDTVVRYGAGATLELVVEAISAGKRSTLRDQDVIGDSEWATLLRYAAGQEGIASDDRAPYGAQGRRCSSIFSADYGGSHFAVLEPASTAYGWRVAQVGTGTGQRHGDGEVIAQNLHGRV